MDSDPQEQVVLRLHKKARKSMLKMQKNWIMSMKKPISCIITFLFFIITNCGFCAEKFYEPKPASLRSNEVNLRVGPGREYPIEWVYNRAGLPVLIISEFGTWRKIRDYEGTEGWVHQSMLTSGKTVMVINKMQYLMNSGSFSATKLARVDPLVIGKLVKCQGQWCQVKIDKLKGWLEKQHLFGTQ